MQLWLIISLMLAGFFLVFMELFLPGGVIGLLGIILMLGSLVAVFNNYGLLIGGLTSLLTIVAAFFSCSLWFKYFPRTKMGRKFITQNDSRDWHSYDPTLQELQGKNGYSHTTLRPAGIAIIDKLKRDVVTQGEMIARGKAITVIQVEGNRIVVAENEKENAAETKT